MSPIRGMTLGTPNTMVEEGGVDFGSYSIQSMNTTVLMQMYQNTANMWKDITSFSKDMMSVAYDLTKFKYDKWKQMTKQRIAAKAAMEQDPEAKEFRDKIEVLKRKKEGDRRPGPSSGLTSRQKQSDDETIPYSERTTLSAENKEHVQMLERLNSLDPDSEEARAILRKLQAEFK